MIMVGKILKKVKSLSKGFLVLFAFVSLLLAPFLTRGAIQPCSEGKLREKSDFIIEGTIKDRFCRGTAEEKCQEQIKECRLKIRVTKNIKGDYQAGEVIDLKTKLVFPPQDAQNCKRIEKKLGPIKNGKDLTKGQAVEYYGGLEKECPGDFIQTISQTDKNTETNSNAWFWVMATILGLLLWAYSIKKEVKEKSGEE